MGGGRRTADDPGISSFPLEPLDLRAQRRRRDVLARRGAAEVQFLGERHEVAQLAQLDAAPVGGIGHGPDHHGSLRRLTSVDASLKCYR